ncbi:MAG: 4-hydroxy-3-methylbut-2-enyl diphosphate reductase [Minisyncoccia bacterium]
MKIIFAKHLGFCAGVRRALILAKKVLKTGPKPVYFLGDLVHNEKVMEKITKWGGKIIGNPNEIKKGSLVLRAHGEILSEETILNLKKKKIKIFDATCPLVKKAQNSAILLKKQGFLVLIIGDKKHAEVEGIKKAVQNEAIVIENEKDLKKIIKNISKIKQKIGIVSQTTQEVENMNNILNILKKKFKNLKYLDTLCSEVKARQKEIKEIIKRADGILVIGSKDSANTKRLVILAEKAKRKTWWINSLKDLKQIDFFNIKTLGVISGTSAPDWEINKIKKWLLKYKK